MVFYFAPIPEVTDADMEFSASQSADLTGFEDKSIFKQHRLIFAVIAQFMYVGAQVSVASQFIKYAQTVAGLTSTNASNRYAVGQACFAVGRFASAGLILVMKPRYILLVSSSFIILFNALAIGIKGEAGLAMLTLVLFFESNQFPLILTLGIRGLGRHTKRGSSWIIAAISGGAFFPPMTGFAADRWGWNIGMFVPLIGFIFSWMFALYINLVNPGQLDGARESKIGYKDENGVIGDISRDKRVSLSHIELSVMPNKGE